MTDVFNTDLELDGFRRNNLEWRKVRDSYDKVSATKLQRGIKPFPLPLFLKLFGHQKVLNTYVISRRPANELDYQTEFAADYKDISMKTMDKNREDPGLTKTLDFPGVGLSITAGEDGNKVGGQALKRDALPSRPIFQRNLRVPGRYFPKPAYSETDSLTLSLPINDNIPSKETDRQRTARNAATPGNVTKMAANINTSRTTGRLVRGPMCKPPEILSLNPGKSPTWSNLTNSPVKSLPTLCTNGFSPVKKVNNSVDNLINDPDRLPMSFRIEERPSTIAGGGDFYDQNGDVAGDFSPARLPTCNHRQVSFPRAGTEFLAVLHGRPKTLHHREVGESMGVEMLSKEGRSKTHVGFITDG